MLRKLALLCILGSFSLFAFAETQMITELNKLADEDPAFAVARAQTLQDQVVQMIDTNLFYVGKGKYVTLADFENVQTSNGTKLVLPDLKSLGLKAQKLLPSLGTIGVNPAELINCPGPIREEVYGIALDGNGLKLATWEEYLGYVTDTYVTAVSYPAILAPENAPNNYYVAVSRVITPDAEGLSDEHYNLTIGTCKADGVLTDKTQYLALAGDKEIVLNNLNGGVKLTLAVMQGKDVKKEFVLGGQGVGLTYLSNVIFRKDAFLKEFKAVFVDKTAIVAANNANTTVKKEEVANDEDDFAKAFALFNAIYSSVKKQDTPTNNAPAVAEAKVEEPAKKKFSDEDKAKFGELVVKHFGQEVATFFNDGFAAIQDGNKTQLTSVIK